MVLPNFEENLKKYAELLVATGINVSKDHTVVLSIDVDQAPLARLVSEAAYERGAKKVIVNWADDGLTRLDYQHQDIETLKDVPEYKIAEMDYIIEEGASRISVRSSDPDALAGLDSDKIAESQKARSTAMRPMMEATQANKISWLVASAAGEEWAKKVFPDLETTEEQVDALWNAIFESVHLYEEDPIAYWENKVDTLQTKADELNKEAFTALHYKAPGTDLTVGLPKGHRWEGAGSTNARGEIFVANMPTEEVFSAPDANRVDGVVVSTKPLSYAGSIIEGMEFHFKDGKVTKVTADKGEEVIKKLIEQDDGASRLGEVALVPDESPISQSGLTFFNTLFDENASNHLALGSAYAFSLEGGTEMTREELNKAGLNESNTHVDFMIGSDQMDIDGIKEDGSSVPVFRNGTWA
ncbi:Leucyl aminopeptidase (aminopeptidase T) [Atopostipes suicloacalis DSM 15692]|uniref:Leucyl aminopeptidase (Aminopeptidase T) n=1 Tax=Atopostipes suicloacalis DSM 15692 TaxID=1121025 RepID=A0A1M4YXB2_9LACT|nr:aminopeptidase [Atopostipes suicloacalis]SHF10449.1 Leucyl aminopeptidase (aminopeptidase T) [Atopostipes suicloacalis DSM 15692]